MAEYDVEIAVNSSSYDTSGHHLSGLDIDTATIVSITSSCIILISGCIAVICLILYMKKTDSRYRSNRTCAKCGHGLTTTSSEESSRVPIRSESTQVISGQPIDQSLVVKRPSLAPSLALLRGQPLDSMSGHLFGPQPNEAKGKLPSIIRKSEETTTNPYAISQMTHFDDKLKVETFSGVIGEPAYIMKSSLDGCIQPLNHDYKSNQCHSQCSSNHEELIRCYEFGHSLRLNPITSSCEAVVSCFDEESLYRSSDRDDTPTDPGIREFTKSPPKPNERRQGGVVFHLQQQPIRYLDKSVSSSSSSSTTTPVNNEQNFGAIPRDRSRKPQWKESSSAQTLKLGFKEGLSSEEEEEEEETSSTKFKYFKVQNETRKQEMESFSAKNEIDC